MNASITDFYQTQAAKVRAKYDAAHAAAYDAIGRRAAYDAYITDLAALCGAGVKQPSATPVAYTRALTTLGEWCHSNPITTPVATPRASPEHVYKTQMIHARIKNDVGEEHPNMLNNPPRLPAGNSALAKALDVARAKYDAAKQIAYDAYIADLATLCNAPAQRISGDVTNS